MLPAFDCLFHTWEASMGFAEYSNDDGLGLAELVKKKEIKPAELVEAAIDRIERHNPQLNAVVFKAFDEASAMARTNLSGPFAGVPMLLKDILGFKKGWPNRDGSRFVPSDGRFTADEGRSWRQS
jgi:amidase